MTTKKENKNMINETQPTEEELRKRISTLEGRKNQLRESEGYKFSSVLFANLSAVPEKARAFWNSRRDYSKCEKDLDRTETELYAIQRGEWDAFAQDPNRYSRKVTPSMVQDDSRFRVLDSRFMPGGNRR